MYENELAYSAAGNLKKVLYKAVIHSLNFGRMHNTYANELVLVSSRRTTSPFMKAYK
jgi:hypothetical protein